MAELGKNPAKYDWMAVRVGVVLGDYTAGDKWALSIGEKDAISVQGAGKLNARAGDRVAITGTFRHLPPGEHQLIDATMEVIPLDVSVAELVKNTGKYDGRLIRIETILAKFLPQDDWSHAVKEPGVGNIEIEGKGKPDARDGDKVSIVGVFQYRPKTFGERIILLTKMQKLEQKKP